MDAHDSLLFIFREIPCADTVTVSMLFSAQSEVAKMLQDQWFRNYVESFSDTVFTSAVQSEVAIVVEKPNKMKKGPLVSYCEVLKVIVRYQSYCEISEVVRGKKR